MNQLQKEAYKNLKCCICKCYLSVSPIRLDHNLGYICGRCCPKNSEAPIVQIYETFAAHFKFPCSYDRNGCSKMLDWNDVLEHETTCTYHDYTCPSVPLDVCKWRGSLAEMQLHLEAAHDACVRNWSNFYLPKKLNGQMNKLLVGKSEKFLLKTFMDKETNTLWIGLFSLGTSDNVKRTFSIVLRYNLNSTVLKNNPVHKLRSWVCDFSQMVRINFDHLVSMLGGLNIMYRVELDEETEKPKDAPKNVPLDTKNLLQELECPVCCKYMMPPIYICILGHSICNICQTSLKICPQCKSPLLKTRNYPLEKLTELMQFPCRNDELNCKFKGTINDITLHEKKCLLENHKSCPVSKKCTWKGMANKIYSHVEKVHPSCCLLKLNAISAYSMNSEASFIVVFDNNMFNVLIKNHIANGPVCWAVKHLDLKLEEKPEFKYRLEFVDQTKSGREFILNDFCYPQSENEFSPKLLFSQSLLKPFFDDNHLLRFKISIEKM